MNFFNLYFNCTFVGISDCHYLKSNFHVLERQKNLFKRHSIHAPDI